MPGGTKAPKGGPNWILILFTVLGLIAIVLVVIVVVTQLFRPKSGMVLDTKNLPLGTTKERIYVSIVGDYSVSFFADEYDKFEIKVVEDYSHHQPLWIVSEVSPITFLADDFSSSHSSIVYTSKPFTVTDPSGHKQEWYVDVTIYKDFNKQTDPNYPIIQQANVYPCAGKGQAACPIVTP